MNILVTGGAGFIGSHLVESLLKLGHHVWTLDDLSTGRLDYLEGIIKNPRHKFVQGSVTDKKLLKKLIAKVDLVYHLAAVLGVKNTVEDPLKVIEGNIDGTRNVLELAYLYKSKVVFSSTSEIYGKNELLPFHETSDRVYGSTEIHRWCYATAKSLDEHMCFAYAAKGLPVTVLRYFNAYGPRQINSQYGGVVARFIRAALMEEPLEVHGNGRQTRCFTYVGDTVSGSIQALKKEANGIAINIGSNQPIAIRELAKLVVDLTKSKSQLVLKTYEEAYGVGYEDMKSRVPDLSRARSILGYRPTVRLEEGLLQTIEWYKQHR
ncbi:NAD-dependent epimerase/dehydratase family protein [Paenibacillus sp. RC67]|uniref:NAD-dependent epimerase/dehydratase family protein n=1 Tax=Paenibacillus sp. RC67 TaxID=3039392 RepID=UPI0024ADE1FF|nr:NAD-dependent epimerase/dehydratase family protein [Paenibacillus sp. RC67]